MNYFSYLCAMKIVDLKEKRFGRLEVIRLTGSSRGGSKEWECLCDCGTRCLVTTRHLNRKNCNIRSCGCLAKENYGANHQDWTGYKEISGTFWSQHILRSGRSDKRKPLEITITKEYIWNLFEIQEGCCALSGLKISFPLRWSDHNWTASLDRIDSSKGYIPSNVQWVHKHINTMKNSYNNEYFKELCSLIHNKSVGNSCPIK